MKHSQEVVNKVKNMRRKNLSFSAIGRRLNLTKGQVLSLYYRYVLHINKNQRYKKKMSVDYVPPDTRPTVGYVPGLTSTVYYKLAEKKA